ncbi:MAG: threonine-phosphate decarboxylase CobD [Hyphomicrobiales bacterium]|nr:threonine-phosphate decarboxylase CobD [Hyphomicrobiales bacterium]
MKHGGDLSSASKLFNAHGKDWLDLSTGINPEPYPFAPPSAQSWRRLPQSGALERLLGAARKTYGAGNDTAIAAAPGTQILIQLLPLLVRADKVAIVGPTYSEHALCWQAAGAEVVTIGDLACPKGCSAVVVVNPNNPDGRSWTPRRILDCASEMAQRGGFLIVDEAFADVRPEISVASHAGGQGLLVLRSFGKFFGLAGVRLGFALGPQGVIGRMIDMLGPWAVSGPAIEIGAQALNDLDWQDKARAICAGMAARLDALLVGAGFEMIGGAALFRLGCHGQAQAIHRDLARQGVWVRRFEDHPQWLRFGLPGGEAQLSRLAAGLENQKRARSPT